MEIISENTPQEEYDIVIIGGGPATLAFFTYIIQSHLLSQFMQLEILIIERDYSFGSGKLGKYGIFSNTPAYDFFNILYPKKEEKNSLFQNISEIYKNKILEKLNNVNVTKCIKKYDYSKVPLPLVGHFFECVGNTILSYIDEKYKKKIFAYNTEVTEIEILNKPRTINEITKQHNYRITTLRKDVIKNIKSKVIILSNGNKIRIGKKLLEKYKAINTENVYHSDYFLQEEGYKKIMEILKLREENKICILGGSHSAFSSAWLLLNKPADYKLSMKNQFTPKLDKDCKSCENNGDSKCGCYGVVKEKNWEPIPRGEKFPNFEIKILYRDHNKTILYYNSEKVDLLGQEKYVKMIQCAEFSEQKKHLENADLIICAFGYKSQPITFYEKTASGLRKNIKFSFDFKNKEFQIDNHLHLMDTNKNSFHSIFGLGHGYTTLPRINFKGNNNVNNNHVRYSFYYFHSYISKKLYSEIYELFSSKMIRYKIIKIEEIVNYKTVKLSTLNNKVIETLQNSHDKKSCLVPLNRNLSKEILSNNPIVTSNSENKLILPDINKHHTNRFKSTNITKRAKTIEPKLNNINHHGENKLITEVNKVDNNEKYDQNKIKNVKVVSVNFNKSKSKSKPPKTIKIKKPKLKKLNKKSMKIKKLVIIYIWKYSFMHNKLPIFFQKDTRNIYTYDFEMEKWNLRENFSSDMIPIFPSNYRIAEITDMSFLITGGEIENQTTNQCFVYKHLTSNFTKISNMNHPRKNHSIIFSDDICFVFGGKDNDNNLIANCEKYEVKSDKWILINSLIFPRANSTALLKDKNKIYIFGGLREEENSSQFNKIESYTISEDKFEIISINISFPISSSFVSFIDEGKVLIAGGNLDNKILSESHLVNLVDGKVSEIEFSIDGWAENFPVYFISNNLHFFYFNNDTRDFPLCKKYIFDLNVKN